MKRWLLLFAAVMLGPPSVSAWDATGHMLIDAIAARRLKPGVAEKIEALARRLDTDYNDGIPYHMATIGCWMDNIRPDAHYAYGPLHYLNVPYTPAASPFAVPQPPHLLSALQDAQERLQKPGESEKDRAVALAMLIHLVGDVHQPLHCADWDDRGGNGYFIHGIPFSDISSKRPATLHTFWDKAFRFDASDGKILEVYQGPGRSQERPKRVDEGIIKDESEKIISRFPPESLQELQEHPTPLKWAEESYTIACRFAYPNQPHPTDAEAVPLTADYVHRAHEIACRRIALAGCRLGDLLNQLFAN